MLAFMSPAAPDPTSRAGRAVLAALREDPGASITQIQDATERTLGRRVDHKTVTKYRRLWRARAERSAPSGAVAAC